MDFSTSSTNRPRRIRSRFSFFSVSESHFAAFFFAIQLFGGLLLLSGYFVPLALTLLAAELYNILAFHLTLASASIAPALVASVLWVLVFLQYRESFDGIFSAKRATASGPPRRMSSHGSSCWPLMRRAKIPARSLGGTCKAQNSLTTSETLMFPTSLALNQRFSYRQQVLRSSDGEKEKTNEHDNKLR